MLKMKQLSAAAHSAAEFAEWMRTSYRNVAAPLSSLRVLLSPSVQEIIPQNIRDRVPQNSAATLSNVKGGLIVLAIVLAAVHQFTAKRTSPAVRGIIQLVILIVSVGIFGAAVALT